MDPDRWTGVELRHLIALEAVARETSFGRAAASLGYTQSAISQQIATLERIVGEKLVERPGGPRKVSLTEAGEVLLRHAEAIVSRLSAAQADMDALGSGLAGTLRVGVYQSVGEHILPALMTRFVGSWPRVEVSLTEAGEVLLRHAEAIVSRLSAAQADMDALGSGLAGTLHVGVYQSVGEHILPALMTRFVESWPRVEVSLEESARDTELLERIQRREIDPTFIITHRLPRDEAPRAYATFLAKEDGCEKVVLKP